MPPIYLYSFNQFAPIFLYSFCRFPPFFILAKSIFLPNVGCSNIKDTYSACPFDGYIAQVIGIPFQQIVKPFNSALFRYHRIAIFIPTMNGLAQESLNLFSPRLCHVDVIQIFKVTSRYASQTD